MHESAKYLISFSLLFGLSSVHGLPFVQAPPRLPPVFRVGVANDGAGGTTAWAPGLRFKTPVGIKVKRATCDEIYPGECACIGSVEEDVCASGACALCQGIGHHGPV